MPAFSLSSSNRVSSTHSSFDLDKFSISSWKIANLGRVYRQTNRHAGIIFRGRRMRQTQKTREWQSHSTTRSHTARLAVARPRATALRTDRHECEDACEAVWRKSAALPGPTCCTERLCKHKGRMQLSSLLVGLAHSLNQALYHARTLTEERVTAEHGCGRPSVHATCTPT